MDRIERSIKLLENNDCITSSKKHHTDKAIKPRPHLNKEAVRLMETWYNQNIDHPYPTPATIEVLAQTGNVGAEQVKKWFANKRNRSQNTRTLTEIAIQKRRMGHINTQ